MDPLLQAADLRFKVRGSTRVTPPRAIGSPRTATHSLQRQPSTDTQSIAQFKSLAKEYDLLAMLEDSCQEFNWDNFSDLVIQVRSKVQATRAQLEEKINEARENHGQVEIVEAQLGVASYTLRTSRTEQVNGIYSKVELQSVSSGKKIDSYLERARFGLAWEDYSFARKALDESTKLLTLGGDWDRRNRLRVYSGLYAMCARDFTLASKEFLSGVATFTAEEVFNYDRFVMYTMLVSVVALDRVELKQKIVNSAEIIAVLDSCYQTQASSYQQLSPLDMETKQNCATVGRFVQALYDCQYRTFMQELLNVHEMLQKDRYLARHIQWFLREMRIKAYEQFLASYKSVQLAHMADSFGVSEQFMDVELAKCIASKRLSAKIDKVSGVVETNRPDLVNQKYQQVIKQGDLLLTRVQKLARAVNV